MQANLYEESSKRAKSSVRSEQSRRALCGSSARRDLWGGSRVTGWSTWSTLIVKKLYSINSNKYINIRKENEKSLISTHYYDCGIDC